MGRVVSADPRKAPRWVRVHPLVYEHLREEAQARGLTVSELVRRVLRRMEGVRLLPGPRRRNTRLWPRLALRVDQKTWEHLRYAARVYHLTLTDALNLRLAHFLGSLEEYLLLRTDL
jgi:antitoxin component of RelBE/YafQ-DinJ toxin-antitoxin module